jgi:hypothetical protein
MHKLCSLFRNFGSRYQRLGTCCCCLSTSRVVSTTDRYLLLPVSRVEVGSVFITTFVNNVTSSNLVQNLKVVHKYPFFQALYYKAQ